MDSTLRSQGLCSTSYALQTQQQKLLASSKLDHRRSKPMNDRIQGTCPENHRSRLVCESQPSYPELEKMINEKNASSGSEETMKVSFRDVDPFSLWVWFEHHNPIAEKDRELLETVLESWFVIGRMGGFNCMNLQVSENAAGNSSFYRYNAEEADTSMQALFMDCRTVESQGNWTRFWLNMGTADEIALDILINALNTFSKENVGIKQMIVGGENEDWPVPKPTETEDEDIDLKPPPP